MKKIYSINKKYQVSSIKPACRQAGIKNWQAKIEIAVRG